MTAMTMYVIMSELFRTQPSIHTLSRTQNTANKFGGYERQLAIGTSRVLQKNEYIYGNAVSSNKISMTVII